MFCPMRGHNGHFPLFVFVRQKSQGKPCLKPRAKYKSPQDPDHIHFSEMLTQEIFLIKKAPNQWSGALKVFTFDPYS